MVNYLHSNWGGELRGSFKSGNECCEPILPMWASLFPIAHERMKEKVQVLFG